MGIMISYSGRLADPRRLDEMVDDLQTWAERMQWRTWTVEQLVAQEHIQPTDLRGITVSVHPQCEALHFHVDSEGRFVHHMYYALVRDAGLRSALAQSLQGTTLAGAADDVPSEAEAAEGVADDGEPSEFLREGVLHNWTKTQFGGVTAHVQACEVLRHVRDHYAPELQVRDDTGYFEHGREDDLVRELGRVDHTIDMVKRAAQRISDEGGIGSLDELLDKLTSYMNDEHDRFH